MSHVSQDTENGHIDAQADSTQSSSSQGTKPETVELTATEKHAGERKANDDADMQLRPKYVEGWKLHVLTVGLWISLFLSTLETTIVSTSLVSITDSLDGFDMRDWVVTAYLLTYTGFLIIYAKLSDVFGNKFMIILALVVFTAFSIACGLTNDILSLIILRAFQGIGASGMYAMIMVLAPTLVPRAKFGKYIAVVSSVFVVASILGPVLGGAITNSGSWRWVFLLNGPGGTLSIVLLVFFLPSSSEDLKLSARLRGKFSKASLSRIDVLGVFLLLSASVLLVFSLEEGGARFRWNSAIIIATLVLACIGWVAFIGWEYLIERLESSKQEPIFPLRLLKGRVRASMMATAFFIGFPFVSVVVNIPQRAQAVDGLSPVQAGLTLLPLLLSSPLATAISGVLTSNFKVYPVYIIIGGAVLQLIGVGLATSLPTNTTDVARAQYGYEVLMGIGFGSGLSTILTLGPLVVEERDVAVTMGALTQIRVLGGTIGLAICSTILNNHVASKLQSIISPEQLAAISNSLSAIEKLTSEQQYAVRTSFSEGYNKQMQVMAIFSGVALLTSLLMWEQKPRSLRSDN